MRQLIVYAGWFSVLLSSIGLIRMLRRPIPPMQPRRVYVGQIFAAAGSILLGLALTQVNNLNWFAWFCISVGSVLAFLSLVIMLRRHA